MTDDTSSSGRQDAAWRGVSGQGVARRDLAGQGPLVASDRDLADHHDQIPPSTTAGILIRVSTARQGEHGISTATQREGCDAYCDRKGLSTSIVGEDHKSGTSFDRAGYQKLLEAAKRGEIQHLVVYKIDRFSRASLAKSLLELEDFITAGVK